MDQDATYMEAGLGPGHIVLDGDLALPHNFQPMSIVAKRLDRSRKARHVRVPVKKTLTDTMMVQLKLNRLLIGTMTFDLG